MAVPHARPWLFGIQSRGVAVTNKLNALSRENNRHCCNVIGATAGMTVAYRTSVQRRA
jgi:hypothetical protein